MGAYAIVVLFKIFRFEYKRLKIDVFVIHWFSCSASDSPLMAGDWFGCEKKRGNLYLLPSYQSRLLALPINSRMATQKPTPVYVIYVNPAEALTSRCAECMVLHIHGHLPLLNP